MAALQVVRCGFAGDSSIPRCFCRDVEDAVPYNTETDAKPIFGFAAEKEEPHHRSTGRRLRRLVTLWCGSDALGRFELPDVRRAAAAIRRGFDVLRTRSAVRIPTPKCKRRGTPDGMPLLLELLGRFELPTSSLPRMRSTY